MVKHWRWGCRSRNLLWFERCVSGIPACASDSAFGTDTSTVLIEFHTYSQTAIGPALSILHDCDFAFRSMTVIGNVSLTLNSSNTSKPTLW